MLSDCHLHKHRLINLLWTKVSERGWGSLLWADSSALLNPQNFANTIGKPGTPVNEERASRIIELRKYWIAATIARQERCGQYADNKNVMDIETNKIVFPITVSDAQELTSEFDTSQQHPDPEPDEPIPAPPPPPPPPAPPRPQP
jgi:hypothetical protein